MPHHCHIIETGNESFRFKQSSAIAKQRTKSRENSKRFLQIIKNIDVGDQIDSIQIDYIKFLMIPAPMNPWSILFWRQQPRVPMSNCRCQPLAARLRFLTVPLCANMFVRLPKR